MTNVVRWDPFADFRSPRGMAFARPWRWTMEAPTESRGFAVEVSETEGEVDVKAALPGIKPEEVEVSINKDVLTIKAEHKSDAEDTKRDYYRREISYGSYQRSFSLPFAVDADKAEASFENGMLTLRLPKAEALRPKQIKVTAGSAATTATEPTADASSN